MSIPPITIERIAGVAIDISLMAAPRGESAYQAWLAMGNEGSLADFLAALKGDPGPIAALQDVQVSTGDPGSQASAALVGDRGEQVLQLEVPRGATGATGQGVVPPMTIAALETLDPPAAPGSVAIASDGARPDGSPGLPVWFDGTAWLTFLNEPVEPVDVEISGDLLIGATLAVEGTWPSIQWLANGADISGATDSEYEIQSSDLGKTISVRLGLSLGGTIVVEAGVAEWDPEDMFAGGAFGWFYDPANYTPGNLPSAAGTGPTLLQANGAVQPSLEQDEQSGAWYLDISGKWIASAATQTLTFPFYMAAAVQRGSSSAGMFLAFGASNTNKLAISDANNFGRHAAEFRSSATGQKLAQPDGGSSPLNTPSIIELICYADGIKVAVNGSDWSDFVPFGVTVDPITSARIGINITGAASSSTISNGRFYGSFGYAGEPSDTDRAGIVRKLKQMSGLIVYDSLAYHLVAGLGQSNNQGRSGEAPMVATDWGVAASYINGGALTALRDPVRSGGTTFANGLALDSSFHPAFAQALYDTSGLHELFVGAAVGGQGLTTGGWSSSGTLLDEAAEKAAAAARHVERVGGSIESVSVLWQGGEQDAQAGVSASTFKAAIIDLRNRARAKFAQAFEAAGCSTSVVEKAAGLTVLCMAVDRTDNSSDDANFAAINAAISEACEAEEGMHLVMPYQDFEGQGLLRDETVDIHWLAAAQVTAGTIAGETAGPILAPA